MKLAAATALLVDADRVARHGCWSLLESHGMGACYQADSVADAYPIFEQHSPDVIVQAWAMDKPD
ncbi:MAG: hypothetical protein L0H29_03045, partial [Sinobacteraceae bacterium]|nr:hypothetical protein [Nevskiaceae bacterium]